MRKEIFRMGHAEAASFLESAPIVHLAGTGADGGPVLRTVHGVIVRGALAFHGAPVGEKTETIGREAVASAEETIASIPSYFLDPERACPATTLYRSVQVHGRIERVDDPEHKAEVLAALMRKYQPEGGYAPIAAHDPRYTKAISGIMILRLPLERLDGKAKLAQNRTPEERCHLLEQLWKRGAPGDLRAIELIRAANPVTPLPAFLRGPHDTTLAAWLGPADAPAAARLLADAYWNGGRTPEEIARAHLDSSAWVGARDQDGTLVATARALSDTVRRAWIYDVVISAVLRRRGAGKALLQLLLDHPALRRVGRVYLRTRDAQPFYQRFGFEDRAIELARDPIAASDMVLLRPPSAQPAASEPIAGPPNAAP